VWRGEEEEDKKEGPSSFTRGYRISLLAYLGANQRTKGYKQDEEFG